MEVKSKEQKTFTYTLTLTSSELDELLEQYPYRLSSNKSKYAVGGNKIMSLFSKLNNARANDLLE